QDTNNQYRFLVGLKGKKWGWNWDSGLLYTWATVDDLSYAVSSTALAQQIGLSTPDAYNPFNGGNLANPSLGDATPSSASALSKILVPIHRKDETTLGL